MLLKLQKGNSKFITKINIQGNIETVGVTNQRETTVAWNRKTNQPYMNAIVWNDMRTKTICQDIIKENNGNQNHFKHINGLPINTYFSAFKIKWQHTTYIYFRML